MSKKTINEPMGDDTDLRIEYDHKGNLTASYWVVDSAEPYQTKLVDNLIDTTIQNEVKDHTIQQFHNEKEQSAKQRKQASKNANNAKAETGEKKAVLVDKWLKKLWETEKIESMTLHNSKKVNGEKGASDTSTEVDNLTDEIKVKLGDETKADSEEKVIDLISPSFVRERIKHLKKQPK